MFLLVRLRWWAGALWVASIGLGACGGGFDGRPAAPPPDTTAEAVPVMAPPTSLSDRADAVVAALARRNWQALAALVHPARGVRFAPYAYVDTTDGVVLSREAVAGLASDARIYLWGAYDGTGEPIRLPFTAYYHQFVYDRAFAEAVQGASDTQLGGGNTTNNIAAVFGPEASFIEYHVPGSEEYGGMDWASLRLVFERADGAWYLVGIVHDQWTI